MTSITGPGDVTGDGKADILARDGAGALRVYPGNGNGPVGAGVVVNTSSPLFADLNPIVAPGNVDRAVGNDLTGVDGAGVLWLFQGDNAGQFGPGLQISAGWGALTFAG